MTDRLSLYNGALRLLGERKLASLTEDRGPRHYLDDVWDDGIVRRCLEAGQWTFAIRKVSVDASSSVEPQLDQYIYAFEKPEDLVRLAGISSSASGDPLTDYDFAGGFFFANLDPIYVRYVSDDQDYGGDYSLWPESFVDYVQASMASEIAPRLSASDAHMERVDAKKDQALARLVYIDGMNSPSIRPPLGSWARARLSGGRSGYNPERR
ncbi:MAG TPA: hypothetical protein PKI99_00675 [Terrimesophilobacter sp.]|nr:hypothetical protein [Terrimesophilobacter sp.]